MEMQFIEEATISEMKCHGKRASTRRDVVIEFHCPIKIKNVITQSLLIRYFEVVHIQDGFWGFNFEKMKCYSLMSDWKSGSVQDSIEGPVSVNSLMNYQMGFDGMLFELPLAVFHHITKGSDVEGTIIHFESYIITTAFYGYPKEIKKGKFRRVTVGIVNTSSDEVVGLYELWKDEIERLPDLIEAVLEMYPNYTHVETSNILRKCNCCEGGFEVCFATKNDLAEFEMFSSDEDFDQDGFDLGQDWGDQ